MRSMLLLCACVCVLVAVCHAAPAPAPATLDAAETAAIEPQNDKEVIEIINLSNFGQSDRDKRDINMLRQLFPGLAQILDRLIQELISQSFRVIGRVVLQNAGSLGGLLGGGGGGGGGGDGDGRSRVSVSLPTFPPDEDDEDEDEEENASGSSTTTTTISNTVAKRDVSSQQAEDAQPDENALHGSESQNAEVRVKFDSDQDVAASNGGPSPADESLDGDDADRNKRFLPFGVGLGSGPAGGDHGGAAGGSGNFLFDIIRSTADRAARTAGTVYRMVAGTESLGLGLTATSTSSKSISPGSGATPVGTIAQLVAGAGSGSGATEAGDANANAPEVDVAKGADGYTEGVPGPITRLFVIANRGIANLIQDLILRLAQTSERIVNFKARLVTALI